MTLDPLLAEAHCSLAIVRLLHDWEWAKAEQEFLRARELNPRYLQNLVWYAGLYLVAIQGRFDESIAVAKEAVELREEGGFQGLKLRLGRERLADDLAAIEAVREVVGTDMSLMVDFNQGLQFGEALER